MTEAEKAEADLVTVALRAYQSVSTSTVTRKGMRAAVSAVLARRDEEWRGILTEAVNAAAKVRGRDEL